MVIQASMQKWFEGRFKAVDKLNFKQSPNGLRYSDETYDLYESQSNRANDLHKCFRNLHFSMEGH